MSMSPGNGQDPDFISSREMLARQLLQYRRTWKVSQAWVARKAGTTQRVISLLEAGTYNPGLDLLVRIAEALGMRLDVAFRPERHSILRK